MNRLSIITITFNNFEDLVRTCESIPKLDFIEHIVVNGGSCKKTKEYLDANKNIISLSEKDSGISDAFNKGFKLSSGSYIWFLNSGDRIIDPAYIHYAKKHFGLVDFIHSDLIILKGNVRLHKSPTPGASLLWGMPFLHPTMIVKRSIFDKVGLFDTGIKIAMDLDFVARMQNHGFERNTHYPHPAVEMDGDGISNTQMIKPLIENINIVKKYYGWNFLFTVQLIKLMVVLSINKFLRIFNLENLYPTIRSGGLNIVKLLYKKTKELIWSIKNPGVTFDFSFKYKNQGKPLGFNSQRGQDYYILSNIFNFKTNGFFVDVGANHPISESNTLIFERKYQWDGISIDPIPKFKNLWEENRGTKFINACVADTDGKDVEFTEIISDSWESMLSGVNVEDNHRMKDLGNAEVKKYNLKTSTLSSILDSLNVKKVDVLFIDTEGFEENVLNGINFSKVPIQTICVENDLHNSKIRSLLSKNGYKLKAHILGDDIFVKKNSP